MPAAARMARGLICIMGLGCYGDAVRTMGRHRTGDAAINDSGVSIDSARAATTCDAIPTAPPAALGLDWFYGKYLDANGIPVVASSQVADLALQRTCSVTVAMTAMRDDVRHAMMASRVRVAILATSQVLTDLPEYRDLPTVYPQTNWNRYRGIGATPARPVSATAEENVLCLPSNQTPAESVLVHMLASAVQMGASQTLPAFDDNLLGAWHMSMSSGLWTDTVAEIDPSQYWGLGTLAWYDAAAQANPANGSRNQVGTRATLKAYDPVLASVLIQYYPEVDLPVHCQ